MPPSYEELAALISVLSVQLTAQSALLTEQSKLIEALRVELTGLRRAAGRDCSNSSQPPSQDGPASKAKARAGNDSAEPRDAWSGGSGEAGKADTRKRKQGGRPGHRGGGLAWVARPDRTEKVEPRACGGGGGSLAGAEGRSLRACRCLTCRPWR